MAQDRIGLQSQVVIQTHRNMFAVSISEHIPNRGYVLTLRHKHCVVGQWIGKQKHSSCHDCTDSLHLMQKLAKL